MYINKYIRHFNRHDLGQDTQVLLLVRDEHQTLPCKVYNGSALAKHLVANETINIETHIQACLSHKGAFQVSVLNILDGHLGKYTLLCRLRFASSHPLQ